MEIEQYYILTDLKYIDFQVDYSYNGVQNLNTLAHAVGFESELVTRERQNPADMLGAGPHKCLTGNSQLMYNHCAAKKAREQGMVNQNIQPTLRELSKKEKADIKGDYFQRFLSSGIEEGTPVSEMRKKYLDNKQSYNNAADELESSLKEAKMQLLQTLSADAIKGIHTRAKKKESVEKKLFNKAWKHCEFNSESNWPRLVDQDTLNKLIDLPILNTLYDDIKDLVGGRIIVACREDIIKCADQLKRWLDDNNYEIVSDSDKDFTDKPNEGYYGFHFVVTMPVQESEENIFLKAEIQVHSLLTNAWSEFSHDIVYKRVSWPGVQVIPDEIRKDMEQISKDLISSDERFGTLRNRIYKD
ncbi:MAG: hypothetical protein V3V99_08730 [candidate division Zixibacteria bacterium]